MAFGAIRACYSAPCKFFADDSSTDNRINWYFVPDDRQIYDGVTVFWPRSDVANNQAQSIFEKEGPGVAVRLHNNGADHWSRAGDHVHGDEADFAGRSKREKYFVDGVPPVQPCPIVTTPCICADMQAEHTSFSVTMHSTDYPELDGVVFPMFPGTSHVPHDEAGWWNEVPYIGTWQFQLDLLLVDSPEGCQLQFRWDWIRQAPPDFTFERFQGVTTTISLYDCHAFTFDGFGEILNFGTPTGKNLRFTIP